MHCGSSITLATFPSINRSRSASPCAQGQGSQKPHLRLFGILVVYIGITYILTDPNDDNSQKVQLKQSMLKCIT